jgi:hypothetical protein
MFLYYSLLQTKRNEFRGPDVFVALEVERRERKAWVTWEEGKPPDVIVEITSETTAKIDRVDKKRLYGRLLHVPEYFIYDPFTQDLEGYHLAHLEYQPLAVAQTGRLPVPALGLELGVWNGAYHGVEAPWLRWFTPGGAVLPTEAEGAAQASRERDEAARERDEAARERDEAARARLGSLRFACRQVAAARLGALPADAAARIDAVARAESLEALLADRGAAPDAAAVRAAIDRNR